LTVLKLQILAAFHLVAHHLTAGQYLTDNVGNVPRNMFMKFEVRFGTGICI